MRPSMSPIISVLGSKHKTRSAPTFYFEHHGKELHSKQTYEIQVQPVDPQ